MNEQSDAETDRQVSKSLIETIGKNAQITANRNNNVLIWTGEMS